MITSPQNEVLKLARSLQTRRGRQRSGLFLADAPRTIETLLEAGAAVAHLLVVPGYDRGLCRRAEAAGARVSEVEPARLDEVAEADTPAGCVALVAAPPDTPPARLASPVLVLDAVRDPGNVGTLLRCADAVGAQVALCGGCADPLSPRGVRASAGAVVRVRWWRDEAAAVQERLAAAGIDIVVLDSGGGEDLLTMALPGRVAVVVGNEARGPGEAWQNVGRRCTLPMRTGAESLNAAMAGVVALYAVVRQHGLSAGDDGVGPVPGPQ